MSSDSQKPSCYDSAMSSGDDRNLLNFIATNVEAMRDQMATKDDLVRLESRLEAMREQMATKDDLTRLEHDLRKEMATKDDLAAMATKDDLASLEHRLRSETASKDDLARLKTEVRGDFEQVHLRFDTLERVISTRFGQVETDLSRIRSVLYLLVKDKPDML